MESLKKILDKLKEFHSWDDVWKETENSLKDRERELATQYAKYSRESDKPMMYDEWYKKTQLEQ